MNLPMRKCIWCSKEENVISFKKQAHTIPQSLGGKNVCKNVCDACNYYFGTRTAGMPSVEIVLKEVLHLSQCILLRSTNEIIRHKSEFFDINKKTQKVTAKIKYSVRPSFQDMIVRQFKRGMYKVFLEERERQCGDAHTDRFNFIREFARYNLGDYPLFYAKPFNGVVMFSSPDAKNPEVRFSEYALEIDKEFRIFEFILLGHNILIPTSKSYALNFAKFKQEAKTRPMLMGTEISEIKSINDLDITFQRLNSKSS